MRKIYIAFTILLTMVCMISGCAPKVKIKLLAPGEIKISGISKIAVLPFNSVSPNLATGKYTADKKACELARRCVENTLYSEPHFQLVDLALEKKLVKINKRAKPGDRLDGVLYGQVWWQISDEYKNYMPSKMSLSRWVVREYVCGKTDEGKPIYCSKSLVTQKRDTFYKSHYRTVTASLMMSLSVYRLTPKGQVEKVAQVFEIAKKPAIISNGHFSTNTELIAFKKAKNRITTLTTKEGFGFPDISQLTSLWTPSSASQGKTALDNEVTNITESIPTSVGMKNDLANTVSTRLKNLIQPHSEEFDISMHGLDKKTQTMFMTEAFRGLTKYLALKIANKDTELAQQLLDSLEFEEITKEMLIRKMQAEYAEKQAELPAEKRIPFVKPSLEEITSSANSYLDGHLSDIYNLALSFEGIGDFNRSLEIYRFGFNEYANTDQDFADGIGRCTLALDMDARNSEAYRALEDSQETTKMSN
ncbi:hypothetical protein [Maridesulfovibrio ferrireducens]|uniref:hypothetical protein n=1 Tax=Maridesulfovibrio ferrireducens TaxID=246191 RepID=UPI001A1CE775|nr:hypothetical protein [Maridesulfovibrio ferrireducens]MBI9113085.1 hypothetical protein [Maridesulfovibrio ferrireducens]